MEGGPRMRKQAVQALCSPQGWCHLPPRGHFVPCASSRHEGSWTAGTQASLQPGLPLSEGPWAACHPPWLKWRGR